MTDHKMPDIGMDMGHFLKTRPELFRMERSPIRTVVWLAVILLGVAIVAVAVFAPELFVREGARRQGRISLGFFITPALLFGVGGYGLARWSHRWRTPGGAKMRSAIMESFSDVSPSEVWQVLETAPSIDDPALRSVLRRVFDDQTLPGKFSLDVMHAPEERLLVAAVTRHVRNNPKDPRSGMRAELERAPVIRQGDA